MGEVAVRAEGLSKRYRIGGRQRYKSLRESIMNGLAAPFRRGAGRRAGTIWALRDVSFEVRHGEVVGIIGRNGAGKSTLLKILSRITTPTSGRVEVHGRVGSLLEVGTGFHSELTGRENIYLNGAILGMKKAEIERKFEEIVAFAEVEQFLDTPVKHYSTGMYLRLAFAVAAHLDPEILLVDEVLAVGDAAFQKKCLGKMGDVARGGRTVVFVSHNMAAVRTLCGGAFLLEGGRLAFASDAASCVEHYLAGLQAQESLEVETSGLQRPMVELGDTLRITSVRLETQGGSTVRFGEPLAVEMRFECYKPVREVVFGFSIHSAEGPRLIQCLSLHGGAPVASLQPGEGAITGRLPVNPLMPGHYFLEVGARCASKGLDWLRELIHFEVVETRRIDHPWLETREGYFFAPSEWTTPHPGREP